MRILLDECVNAGLKKAFPDHHVTTVVEAGWSGVKNGRLLALITGQFDIFVTIDQNIRHQQNLTNLSFALLIISAPDNQMQSFLPLFDLLARTVIELRPGMIRCVP